MKLQMRNAPPLLLLRQPSLALRHALPRGRCNSRLSQRTGQSSVFIASYVVRVVPIAAEDQHMIACISSASCVNGTGFRPGHAPPESDHGPFFQGFVTLRIMQVLLLLQPMPAILVILVGSGRHNSPTTIYCRSHTSILT
jgi:hypothetical protein